MESTLPALHIRVVEHDRTVLGDFWNYPNICSPFARIYWVEKGEAYVEHHGRRFHLRPGRLYLTPPFTLSNYRCPRFMILHWIHVTFGLFDEHDLFHTTRCRFEVRADNPRRVALILQQLHRGRGREDAASVLRRFAIVAELAAEFFTGAPRVKDSERQKLERFRPVFDYIQTHLGEPLRIRTLARLAHLQPNYFASCFNACARVPPARYVMQQRIKRAQVLLWSTDEKLESMSEKLGFSSPFHLSKAFKKIVGISPQAFRRQKQSFAPTPAA